MMNDLVRWLKMTMHNFNQDELNDVFPVYNVLSTMLSKDTDVFVFGDGDLDIYEINGQQGCQCTLTRESVSGLTLTPMNFRTLLEYVVTDEMIDCVNIIYDDEHIVLDHELIINLLKHVPTSNISVINQPDHLETDLIIDAYSDHYNVVDRCCDSFMEVMSHLKDENNTNILIDHFSITQMREAAEAFKAYPSTIINFYIITDTDDECKNVNSQWLICLDEVDLYDNKLLKKGMAAFKEGNKKEAFDLFEQAAVHNNYGALSDLGYCYEEGKGVDADQALSLHYYKQAAWYYESYALLTLFNQSVKDDQMNLHLLYLAYQFARIDQEFYSYPDILMALVRYDDLNIAQQIDCLTLAIEHYQKAIDHGHDYHEELEEANRLYHELRA